MYLYNYIAIHLHEVSVDRWWRWVWKLKCAWRLWLRELRHKHGNNFFKNLVIHLEAIIEQLWISTRRPWSSKPSDHDHGTLEMQSEAMIGRTCIPNHMNLEMNVEDVMQGLLWCTSRPWQCKQGGDNHEYLGIHGKTVINRIWRCTRMPPLCPLGYHVCATTEMCVEAITTHVTRCSWRVSCYHLQGHHHDRNLAKQVQAEIKQFRDITRIQAHATIEDITVET